MPTRASIQPPGSLRAYRPSARFAPESSQKNQRIVIRSNWSDSSRRTAATSVTRPAAVSAVRQSIPRGSVSRGFDPRGITRGGGSVPVVNSGSVEGAPSCSLRRCSDSLSCGAEQRGQKSSTSSSLRFLPARPAATRRGSDDRFRAFIHSSRRRAIPAARRDYCRSELPPKWPGSSIAIRPIFVPPSCG